MTMKPHHEVEEDKSQNTYKIEYLECQLVALVTPIGNRQVTTPLDQSPTSQCDKAARSANTEAAALNHELWRITSLV